MAQHDYIIDNQSGAAFRADLNNALAAVASNNSGSSAPSVTYAYQSWADTLNGLLKIRNAANTAWVTIGNLSLANLGLASTAGATFTGAVALPSGSSVVGYLPLASAGVRNQLINGNPIINQRGWVSGTATTAANQFTLDRWFVITPGQSISWSDSGLGIRTVTAPAGGMAQVIEGGNIVGEGAYCLSWVGTATATVNGTAVANGATFYLAGNYNWTVKFSSGTWSQAQLEPGSVVTPFEERPYGLELMLCQRFFLNYGTFHVGMYGDANAQGDGAFPVMMRIDSPSVSFTDLSFVTGRANLWTGVDNSVSFLSGGLVAGSSRLALDAQVSINSANATSLRAYNVKVSAELTS